VTPKSAGKQEAEQRTVAFALKPFRVWGPPKCVPLFRRQPVAQSDSQFLDAFDAPDSRGQICAQEATLCRLVCQAANCAKPEVDCTWGEMTGLEVHAVADNHSLAKRQPWFGAVPVHKFVNRVAIAALSIRAGQAIENRGLRDFKIWQSQDGFCRGTFLFASGLSLHLLWPPTPQAHPATITTRPASVRLARHPPRTPNPGNLVPAVFDECVGDLTLTDTCLREIMSCLPTSQRSG
jgi:hypothetical protein